MARSALKMLRVLWLAGHPVEDFCLKMAANGFEWV